MDRRLRLDLTESLTYWLKPTGADVEREFVQALRDARIESDKPPYVLGDARVVAFTEVPLALSAKLLSGEFGINYAPLGFLFDRRWAFAKGARPVIHQSEQEAALLPASQLHRHVTLDFDRRIDFTWKREWRVATAALALEAGACRPVLPDRDWLRRVREAVTGHAGALALLDDAVILETFL